VSVYNKLTSEQIHFKYIYLQIENKHKAKNPRGENTINKTWNKNWT